MLSKTFLLMSFAVCSGSVIAAELGERAVYECRLDEKPNAQQVATLEIATQPHPQSPRQAWYRLVGTKVNGRTYTIWFLTDSSPFAAIGAVASFERYILEESGRSPIEYIDGHSGRALIPLFDFAHQLLPKGSLEQASALFSQGTYLGHPLVRTRALEPEPILPPSDVRRLVFRTDLLIGTSRNFRDDGSGRPSRKDNYRYVAFTRDDYDEMIAAGVNYFVVKNEQVDWVCRRPVFYEGHGSPPAFPEQLYRPNFLGVRMFIDEPACRLAGRYPPGSSLQTAIEMIHEHIRQEMTNTAYRNVLAGSGLNLGSLGLSEPGIPIWETYVGTSYYQLEVNRVGLVQECRWRIDPNADSEQILMLQRINEEFSVDIPVLPQNLFLWYYSQLRGPARALGTKWGMSIYGQAEPHLRLPSMKLAYDLGAEFIWLWTSDHDHHVPYAEQLDLVRRITAYAGARAPRNLAQLRRSATTAIVLPYGYTLPTCWQLHTWGTHLYPLDRANHLGVPYREVLRPAIQEIARCLRVGIAYDVVPAGTRFDPSGYKRIVWVYEDGSIAVQDQLSPASR